MLGHVSFGVKDLARAGVFYDAVLLPLGWIRLWDDPKGLGYGRPGEGEKLNLFPHADARPPGPGFHLAFDAPDQASVDAFHAAALAAGGTDRGAPGLRRAYSPTYYAAFVMDPDGHRLEAVHQ
ncbi:VOC family protein [Phenylobacterium sp. LH3H17]|uniref:VOC family protein n=1 Tax=Phenylobacterium sp. LH3H17 TaxID=2903901 RepID=UPI0020C98C28|nr:VOC family protein [Phenylobacterium sp. LH3H17]UTP37678.1 VOC family protein [Phenylobacterium sp. LH3H17]